MSNESCSVRYCQKCGSRLIQKHIREESDYVVRTRKCDKCKDRIKTVEFSLDKYNKTIEKLNRILDVVTET